MQMYENNNRLDKSRNYKRFEASRSKSPDTISITATILENKVLPTEDDVDSVKSPFLAEWVFADKHEPFITLFRTKYTFN